MGFDLTAASMRDAMKEMKSFYNKPTHLIFVSPVPVDELPDEFIKMLPEGVEIIAQRD